MIRIVMLLMTMLVWCAAPVWAATATRAQGVFAVLDARDVTGCLHAFVSINRDGTTTFLFYSLVNLCAQTQLASGFGTVPDAVFTVSNVNLPASAQVRLELTIPPDSATFDSSGDIGAISLTFVRSGPYFRSFVGTERLEDLGLTLITRGSWTETSASVTGSVLGATMVDATGLMGNSSTRTFDVSKK